MRRNITKILFALSVLMLLAQFDTSADHIIYIASPTNGARFVAPSNGTVNVTFQIRKRDGTGPIDRLDYQLDDGPWTPLICQNNEYCRPPANHTLAISPGQHTYRVVGSRYIGGIQGYLSVSGAEVTFRGTVEWSRSECFDESDVRNDWEISEGVFCQDR